MPTIFDAVEREFDARRKKAKSSLRAATHHKEELMKTVVKDNVPLTIAHHVLHMEASLSDAIDELAKVRDLIRSVEKAL